MLAARYRPCLCAARYSSISTETRAVYPIRRPGQLRARILQSLPGPLQRACSDLSLGLGYQFGHPMVWKLAIQWEDGRLRQRPHERKHEDMLSSSDLGIRLLIREPSGRNADRGAELLGPFVTRGVATKDRASSAPTQRRASASAGLGFSRLTSLRPAPSPATVGPKLKAEPAAGRRGRRRLRQPALQVRRAS